MSLLVKGLRVLRDEGPRSFLAKTAHRLSLGSKTSMASLVKTDDAAAVDWTVTPPFRLNPRTIGEAPYEVAWIMSPPGNGSGGHQNLFRFIRFMEDAGHRCTIYLYNALGPLSIADVRATLRDSTGYVDLRADIRPYDGSVGDVDALFATGWETAYPAFRDPSDARRFYFVQDFEPLFYATGTESVLAENTYRFGFHGITAGSWLASMLSTDYGMRTDSFDFAVDKEHYHLVNREPRDEVFFYARPVTPRRGFELGLLALRDFHDLRPDIRINMAGWDLSSYEVPFPHVDHSLMDISDLNALYNRCGAALVISLTNLSLLPLELLSAGVTPVVNDAPNNRLVSSNPYISYVAPAPAAMARALAAVFDAPDAVERSVAMSASVDRTDWSDSGRAFLEAFERGMRG